MTLYDEIIHSAPTSGEITASILNYPAAARLRDQDGADLGPAGGTGLDNSWTVQPVAGNADCSEIVSYVFQEASRITTATSQAAVINFTDGDYFCHSMCHTPDFRCEMFGESEAGTRIIGGKFGGLNMDLLSTTVPPGRTKSEHEIFSLWRLPSLFYFYQADGGASVTIRNITFHSETSTDNRAGVKIFSVGGSFSANDPSYENLNLAAFVAIVPFLEEIPPLSQPPGHIFDAGAGYVFCENVTFEAGIDVPRVGFPYGLRSALQAVVFGLHPLLFLSDPLVATLGFFYTLEAPGLPEPVVSYFEIPPLTGSLEMRNCTLRNLSYGIATFQGQIPEDPSIYPTVDWSRASPTSYITFEDCIVEGCGADNIGGTVLITVEGLVPDLDVRVVHNDVSLAGGLYTEFRGGTSFLVDPAVGTYYGKPNLLVIDQNHVNDIFAHLGDFEFWAIDIFGVSALDGEPLAGIRADGSSISHNVILSAGTAPAFEADFALLIYSNSNLRIENNTTQSLFPGVHLIDCTDMTISVAGGSPLAAQIAVDAGIFDVQLEGASRNCIVSCTPPYSASVLDLGTDNNTRRMVVRRDPLLDLSP